MFNVLVHEAKNYLILLVGITSLMLSLVYVGANLAEATAPKPATELFVVPSHGRQADYSAAMDPDTRFAAQEVGGGEGSVPEGE